MATIRYAIGGERCEDDMLNAESIAHDILILKLGDKNNAVSEQQRIITIINGLDADISEGMLENNDHFISSIKKHMSGADMGKTALMMLSAVFKTIHEPKSVSMLGKVLFAEKAVDEDYALALLFRLLESGGATITAAPLGYNELKAGISANKLLDFTEPVQSDKAPDFTEPVQPDNAPGFTEPVQSDKAPDFTELTQTEKALGFTQDDLLKALFIINDEPIADFSFVKDCPALHEYKRVITEAGNMKPDCLTSIPDFTTYPNLVLVIGLSILGQTGKLIELKKKHWSVLLYRY